MSTTYPASVVIVNQIHQVVAHRHCATVSLPQVDVQIGRVGISFFHAIRDQLHLETFALVLPSTAESRLRVVRLQSPETQLPTGYFWADPTYLTERKQIATILADFSPIDTTFASFAWYTEVAAWLKEHIAALGYSVRTLEQWNGRIGGVLLRAITNGPDFWFKAVSDFNSREFSIAQLLADRHPIYFPRILATEPSWNAFLLEHVHGDELHERDDLDVWVKVAELLADLQIEWAGNSPQLLAAGAADLRASVLAQKTPAFLQHVAEAMARQKKCPPAILSQTDLEELGDQLQPLCARVSGLPFADGLANADFSPHNTLITSTGPLFIDWAEACVSLPLIAGEYMWNRMVVEAPERLSWQDALRNAYLSRWFKRYSDEVVEDATRLLSAFSVFAVAMFYHEREATGPSPYDAYLRSLARRLWREVRQLELETYAT